MLKVDLHAHTVHDRADRIRHGTRDLVDHAISLGYHALALTLHDIQRDNTADAAWARERGFVLISGVERTIQGAHVLLINFPADLALGVGRFADVPALKAAWPHGLVVVPHAFYPVGSAMRDRLDQHASWVDAIEVNSLYTRQLDFNRCAVTWANAHGKPLVGNTDLHHLQQMGTTFSLVDAAPDANAICAAIRSGRVEVRTTPVSPLRAAWFFSWMIVGGWLPPTRIED